jgi:hypothetical protein
MYTFCRGATQQTFSVLQQYVLSTRTASLIRVLTKLLKTADGVYETQFHYRVQGGRPVDSIISPVNLVAHVSFISL